MPVDPVDLQDPYTVDPYTGWESFEAADTQDTESLLDLLGTYFAEPGEFTDQFDPYDIDAEQRARELMEISQGQYQSGLTGTEATYGQAQTDYTTGTQTMEDIFALAQQAHGTALESSEAQYGLAGEAKERSIKEAQQARQMGVRGAQTQAGTALGEVFGQARGVRGGFGKGRAAEKSKRGVYSGLGQKKTQLGAQETSGIEAAQAGLEAAGVTKAAQEAAAVSALSQAEITQTAQEADLQSSLSGAQTTYDTSISDLEASLGKAGIAMEGAIDISRESYMDEVFDQIGLIQSQGAEEYVEPYIDPSLNCTSTGGMDRYPVADSDGGHCETGGCFDGETIILMSDGSEKKIKDIKAGDKVIGYTGEINTVKYVDIAPLGNMNLYGFGKEPWFTDGHPFLTPDGWKSAVPEATLNENPSFKDISKMQVGDKLFIGFRIKDDMAYIHRPIKILSYKRSIEFEDDKVVYNLLTDGNNTYHANGFVVHSVQPKFDADYVISGLQGLKKEETEYLFKSVAETDDPEKLLQVLGNAWGISVPKAFKEIMRNMNGNL